MRRTINPVNQSEAQRQRLLDPVLPRMLAVLLTGMALCLPMAQAAETAIADTSCRSGTVTMMTAGKEATVFGFELKGISVPSGNKITDNQTHSCVGVVAVIQGQPSANGFCKYMDPDGDFTLLEWHRTGKRNEGTWKYIFGTGKWKGIQGSGKYQVLTAGKPIAKGTFQNCIRATGRFEVPK